MEKQKIITLKMCEDDFILIQATILENIRRMKIDLIESEYNENGKEIIRKNIEKDKMLLAKIRTCELYNED